MPPLRGRTAMKGRPAMKLGPTLALLAALTFLAPLAGALPAAAQRDIDPAGEYASCMALVHRDPDAAFESAMAWRDFGGGAPARHCVALALLALGQSAEAATRLEALAQEMTDADRPLRAEVFGQAGLAWLVAGQAERADAVLSAAVELDPDNPELWIDRAQALAARGAYRDAIDDLNRAIELAPERADAHAFRASAYRFVDSLDRAAADIKRALMLAPRDPVALLERGNIRRLAGDEAGARSDWVQVLAEAPDTPAADAARANLERLDVKVE